MKAKPEDLTDTLRHLSLTTMAQHYEKLGQEAAREGLRARSQIDSHVAGITLPV